MKILKRLRRVVDDIRHKGLQLAFLRDRWAKQHDIAHRAHELAVEAQKEADKVRAKHPKTARGLDRRAARKRRRSRRAADRAQEIVGRIKVVTQEKQDLKRTKAELEADYKEYRRKHKVTVRGNKVTGGTRAQRLQVAILASIAACASGRRANYYSQAGRTRFDKLITGEQPGVDRSDCSQWFTSLYYACKLPDPNGGSYSDSAPEYTGTLGTNGKPISRAEARRTPAAGVLFGAAPFHHVEAAIGDGSEGTGGHGSAQVDRGTFDLLPGPVAFRKYV